VKSLPISSAAETISPDFRIVKQRKKIKVKTKVMLANPLSKEGRLGGGAGRRLARKCAARRGVAEMSRWAGNLDGDEGRCFFPANEKMLRRFCELSKDGSQFLVMDFPYPKA
jgi:hypothetical protein